MAVEADASSWVLVGRTGPPLLIPRALDGAGCLAMHLDDHAPRATHLEPATAAQLLEAYREGLREADEDPDAWLASRSGVLTTPER